MPLPRPPFALAWMLLALVGACFGAIAHAADDSEPRFSSTLSAAQRAQTGLDQLSTDNVAVIDALVRLDVTALRFQNNNIRTTRFSQRRTEHEREIAGFAHLTAEQVTKLDQFVSLRIPAPVVPFTADLPYATLGVDPAPVTYKRPGLELHGSVSLTYGWSKAGSVRGADTVLTMVDPKRRFALTVGYSEYRGKGLAPYPYPADGTYTPFYRPLPVVDLEDK